MITTADVKPSVNKDPKTVMPTLSVLAGDLRFFLIRPYLIAFSVFNVPESYGVYLLAINLAIVKFIKKFIEQFFEKCEICRRGPNYEQKL